MLTYSVHGLVCVCVPKNGEDIETREPKWDNQKH